MGISERSCRLFFLDLSECHHGSHLLEYRTVCIRRYFWYHRSRRVRGRYSIPIDVHVILNCYSRRFLPRVTAMVTTHKTDRELSDLFIRTGRIQYIILAFILSGFILFGKQFIILWAGPNYADSYIIALLFFIPLTVPLIQNMGITILQARNQMKFRSILYICIALASLVAQIILARFWGGIGCAIGTAGALVLGQILIMNIYYQKRQHLNIVQFWKEISKMSIVPILLIILSSLLLRSIQIDNFVKLSIGIIIFSIIYIPSFWKFGMNNYERELIGSPVKIYFLESANNDKHSR